GMQLVGDHRSGHLHIASDVQIGVRRVDGGVPLGITAEVDALIDTICPEDDQIRRKIRFVSDTVASVVPVAVDINNGARVAGLWNDDLTISAEFEISGEVNNYRTDNSQPTVRLHGDAVHLDHLENIGRPECGALVITFQDRK